MKKLKTIFSPRNLVIWLCVLILIAAIPEIARPAMNRTEAVVTMLCVDRVKEDISVSTTILTPSQGKNATYEVYNGTGATLGEAINNVSRLIGKEMSFAQCQIVALGDSICEESIMPTLDFLTRTKRIGKNSVLINFVGDIVDFSETVSKMNQEKSLKLEEIINFDKRYILTKDSNIESFYKGYFSQISLGIMPQLKVQSQQGDTAIEVQSVDGGSSDSSSQSSGSQSEKKYLINDGTTCVFKKGKKELEISPEDVQKANIFMNDSQKGEIVLEGIYDELYNGEKVLCQVLDKNIKLTPKFEGETPIFKADVEIVVIVDEVVADHPDKNFLQRNKEFITPALIAKLKEKLTTDMLELIDFCKTNKVDLIGVYKQFYHREYKKFKNYLSQIGEKNYLDGIDYQISIKVSTHY
ncbi:MAG: hypothetical protein IKM43_00065 [Clostridia bacterium]|nr:hypothetical protein [Clostridia bacterium]